MTLSFIGSSITIFIKSYDLNLSRNKSAIAPEKVDVQHAMPKFGKLD